MLSEVDRVNSLLLEASKTADDKVKREVNNLVLIGADATALFPGLRKEHTADIVASEYLRSGLEVEGLDWQEMAVYVAINSSEQQQVKWGVRQFIPKKASNQGIYPTMASMLGPHKASSDQWTFSWVKPGDYGMRLLLAACLRIAIKLVFETHTY